MVYIYGGAYTVGEATREVYGPDYFMTKDVVLVTLNYRVDCFGKSAQIDCKYLIFKVGALAFCLI